MSTRTKKRGASELTPTERRVLRSLGRDDLLWEVVDEPYCTIYSEKKGRDERVRLQTVQQMEAGGWIRRVPNPSRNRLDSWEITAKGRAVLKPTA